MRQNVVAADLVVQGIQLDIGGRDGCHGEQKIKADGHRIADGLWECYVVGPEANADQTSWRTELSKPLVDA